MSNKFTQSILERQYQENKRSRKKTESLQIPQETKEKSSLQETNLAKEEPQLLTGKPLEQKRPEQNDDWEMNQVFANNFIDECIQQKPQRTAKNKTFYLDESVISAIKMTAKRKKITESQLVNEILHKILGVN